MRIIWAIAAASIYVAWRLTHPKNAPLPAPKSPVGIIKGPLRATSADHDTAWDEI